LFKALIQIGANIQLLLPDL